MPKINVYLPDDLAAAVRAAGIPVSPVCQHALATAVRTVNRARKAISAIRDPGFDPGHHPVLGSSLHSRMTPRLAEAFRLAGLYPGGPALGSCCSACSRRATTWGYGCCRRWTSIRRAGRGPAAGGPDRADPADATPRATTDPGPGPDLTGPAWRAVATALETAIELGHNYLGCEHLALGLAAETDSVAGRVLRDLGADPAAARKALTSVLAAMPPAGRPIPRPGRKSSARSAQAGRAGGAGSIARRLRRLTRGLGALEGSASASPGARCRTSALTPSPRRQRMTRTGTAWL